jgi:DNA-binding transcriptional MerR regulator
MAEYKIKDLETLTGIKAHTIRIWEKRYNILTPERTDTLIRTYSDEELTLLLNIAILNNNGIKISRIAEMSPQQIAEKVWEVKGKDTIDNSTEILILALIELDEQLFKTTLQELIDSIGLVDTFTKKLIPFLDRIGVMWLVGSISTAQEHFISNLIRQKIISETDKLDVPKSFDRPVMLFLPEHEWHEISLLFYHFVLRNKQLQTVYLGQSLPYEALLESIEKLRPRALVTSWLTAVDEKFIVNYFQNLHKDTEGLPLFAGGYQIHQFSGKLHPSIIEISDVSVLNEIFKLT